jgi:acyl carrier protein
MMIEELRARVRAVVEDYAEIADDAAPLELDSLSLVQLVEALEDTLDFVARAADMTPAHFASVDAIVRFVAGRR